jgi:hypothetical protein
MASSLSALTGSAGVADSLGRACQVVRFCTGLQDNTDNPNEFSTFKFIALVELRAKLSAP